jgi:hypothetical protein
VRRRKTGNASTPFYPSSGGPQGSPAHDSPSLRDRQLFPDDANPLASAPAAPRRTPDRVLARRLRAEILETAEELAKRRRFGFGALRYAATPSRFIAEWKFICVAELAAIEARASKRRAAAC